MTMQRTAPSISRRAFAAGLALTPLVLTGASDHAADAQATPVARPDIFRYTVGDAEVCLFDTDDVGLSPVLGAAGTPSEETDAVWRESGPFVMNNAVPVVATGDSLMLMDAGPWPDLAERMEVEGFSPGDVDVITFSHLHFDHTDGAFTLRGDLAFPNARYVVSRAEHDYWMGEDERPISQYAQPYIGWMRSDARHFIERVASQLELVEWGEEILPGVRMIPAIGHTGGHAAVEITSARETVLHVGDLICNPVLHLEHPEWYIAAAVWPEDDIASRRALMDRAVAEHLLVQTIHFPFPGVGYVEPDGDAWRWLPLA